MRQHAGQMAVPEFRLHQPGFAGPDRGQDAQSIIAGAVAPVLKANIGNGPMTALAATCSSAQGASRA